MSELLRRLNRLYGQTPIQPDKFGKRPALPNEVSRLLVDPRTMEEGVDRYPPTEADLLAKNDEIITQPFTPTENID